ncbi:hypothetical protein JG687_00008027 [Phytophthora cactorum]|uniref:Peptidase S1 domain-containing protein n=1 Tax=Phytophthora cactorum TaxID=29920 RepID=A0A8T1UI44_9STRA|nr:hypothetical protein JG687_00008027 [Phytophthora cactorum]
MVCAGGVANLDSCDGDSGGPLIIESTDGEDVLVGVVSWAKDESCGREGYYGIYSRVSSARNWIDSILGGTLLLTSRSSQLGSALHPFQRAVANDWVRLLFYVDVAKQIAPDETTLETLPHFLLEVEEEIAANVDDEFFAGGFAARASALPVGALFTIEETRQHLHGAVRNYFQLSDVALDSYLVYGNETQLLLPPPLLTVRSDMGEDPVDSLYNITNPSASEQWPAALRMGSEAARQQETRKFFDELDAMELKLVVGMKRKEKVDGDGMEEKLYQWTVVMRYDLLNQGHLEVTMNYDLIHVPLLEGEKRSVGEDMPPVLLLDTSAMFNWVTLMVVVLYQAVEFSLKWAEVKTIAAQHPDYSQRVNKHSIALALRKGAAKDFWFWFVLAVNFATVTCLLATWRHAYRLSLNDTLCFTFASCCALQWGSLVRYLQVNTRFHILGLTLRRGLPRVMQFLVGVLPIFVGFVLFGTVMFGAKVPRFQSASSTATTLFSVANGDEIHDTFNDVAYTPWIGQIYVYSYMILFSYVVLMGGQVRLPAGGQSSLIMVDSDAERQVPGIDGIRGRYKKADVASDVESGATSSPSATSTFSSSSAAADDDAYSMLSPPEKEKKAATALSNVQAVIHWFKSMRLQFGDGLLLQIFFVYFTQGIRSTLCSLGTSYYLNETLALHPAQSESLLVEAARSEREDMAGNLQTLSWISLSVGSVLGSMVSGYALNTFGPLGVFFLSAVGPLCVVLISIKIPEEKYVPQGDIGFLQTVQDQCRALASVVVDPICWRPMLWIFLSNALPPSVGEAMFSFKTAELGFSKSFLGFISTVGSFTLLGTTALYNAYFRDMPFRRMFFRIQLASACVSFAEFVLVSRLNVAFGISDRFFIFGDEILSDVVARLKHMPSLVLCAKICPPGIEGTMFALLMSIYNFSWSVASYGGSWLCNYLQISKTNFTGLATAVTIRSVAKIVPLFLLFMVPATTSISSSSLASKAKSKTAQGRKQSEGGSDSDSAAINLKVQA